MQQEYEAQLVDSQYSHLGHSHGLIRSQVCLKLYLPLPLQVNFDCNRSSVIVAILNGTVSVTSITRIGCIITSNKLSQRKEILQKKKKTLPLMFC